MSFDRQLISHIRLGQHVAAKSMLLKNNYLFKYIDDSGRSLLHISAECGNVEMTQYLIECGCQVNVQDKLGVTPLMLAVTNGKDGDTNEDRRFASIFVGDTVDVLLNANADIYQQDFKKSSSLRKIIKISQSCLETLYVGLFEQTIYCEILKMFLSKVEEEFLLDKELMMKNLREAHCPLALVMFMSNVSVTKYLLNNGYPLNECLRKWSTLHIAVLLADLSNVKVLVEFGADINDQDNINQTPLFLYDLQDDSNIEQLEILKILLNKGASLVIARSDGITLMEYFFTGGGKNTLMVLLESNNDELKKCRIKGKTPLHFCIENHNEDIYAVMELLIKKKKINVDAIDNNGFSALIKAVSAGSVKKMKFLIELGATINYIDIFDKTKLFDVVSDSISYETKYAKQVFILMPLEKKWLLNLRIRIQNDENFTLAKMILRNLVLDEAKSKNVSLFALTKLESKHELKKYYESCQLHLQLLKPIKVYESITLYKLLTETDEKIALYARNSDFSDRYVKSLGIKVGKNIYCDQLLKRIAFAIELAFLRTEAARFICKITQLYPDPNDNIYYNILKYMSREDLLNLMRVSKVFH